MKATDCLFACYLAIIYYQPLFAASTTVSTCQITPPKTATFCKSVCSHHTWTNEYLQQKSPIAEYINTDHCIHLPNISILAKNQDALTGSWRKWWRWSSSQQNEQGRPRHLIYILKEWSCSQKTRLAYWLDSLFISTSVIIFMLCRSMDICSFSTFTTGPWLLSSLTFLWLWLSSLLVWFWPNPYTVSI